MRLKRGDKVELTRRGMIQVTGCPGRKGLTGTVTAVRYFFAGAGLPKTQWVYVDIGTPRNVFLHARVDVMKEETTR